MGLALKGLKLLIKVLYEVLLEYKLPEIRIFLKFFGADLQ